jgi:DNA-directed RNA polymerase specialized sigma24 family protein
MADTGQREVHDDPVLIAIDHLLGVLDDISRDRAAIAKRAELIRTRRQAGVPYAVIVPDESPPLIVERTRHSLNDLVYAAGRLQRAEARALYAEGLSMDRIASLFGISRQRVADLVKHATEEVS